jgi:hypothetical protein
MRDKSRLEADSLVYLSPMATNIIDFSKAQLEWMSDSLCDGFYKGKHNPFELGRVSEDKRSVDFLKCISSVSQHLL